MQGAWVCAQGCPGLGMPRQESQALVLGASRGPSRPAGLLSTTREAAGPQVKPRLSRPPEGLVRKEGSAVQLPWADCFPCSYERRGGNAAPAPPAAGEGEAEQALPAQAGAPHHPHPPTHATSLVGPPPLVARARPPALHLPLIPVSRVPGDPDKTLCKEKLKQNTLVLDARSWHGGGLGPVSHQCG